MIKILHLGDVHLDSPFSSLTPQKSDAHRRALRATFARMMQFAAREEVDMVLIAGDLFDCGFVFRDTLSLLATAFETLSCPVLISPGNHDPYTPDSLYASGKLPSNVTVFSRKQPTRIDFPSLGVTVTGYAFTSERYDAPPLATLPPLPTDRINLLLAHTELDNPLSHYAPISLAALAQSGFAYAALGHVHLHTVPARAGNTTYAYCGMSEGRSFDEPGYGGANLVTLERDEKCPGGVSVRVERKIFAEHRYVLDTLDITGTERDEEVLAKLRELITSRGYGKESALRVRLCGAVALAYTPHLESLAAQAGEGLSLLQLTDDTSPTYDSAYLEEDKTVRGEVYRILRDKLNSPDEKERATATLALRYALLALDGNLSI